MLPEFNNSQVGAVIPRIYVRSKKNFLLKLQWFEYIIAFFYRKLMAHIDAIHVTPGPFSIYKKELLEEIGGFDTNRKNLTEDLEMAFQIQKRHYKILQKFSVSASTVAPPKIKQSMLKELSLLDMYNIDFDVIPGSLENVLICLVSSSSMSKMESTTSSFIFTSTFCAD